MSSGPEHYREAERLLKARPTAPVENVLAAAQVHATLALAAATALALREVTDPPDPEDDDPGGSYSTPVLPLDDFEAWRDTASEGPAARERRIRENTPPDGPS